MKALLVLLAIAALTAPADITELAKHRYLFIIGANHSGTTLFKVRL